MGYVAIVLVLMTGVPLQARGESFDIATFTPPRGWRVDYRASSAAYTDVDQAAGTCCMLGIYASTAASGAGWGK